MGNESSDVAEVNLVIEVSRDPIVYTTIGPVPWSSLTAARNIRRYDYGPTIMPIAHNTPLAVL